MKHLIYVYPIMMTQTQKRILEKFVYQLKINSGYWFHSTGSPPPSEKHFQYSPINTWRHKVFNFISSMYFIIWPDTCHLGKRRLQSEFLCRPSKLQNILLGVLPSGTCLSLLSSGSFSRRLLYYSNFLILCKLFTDMQAKVIDLAAEIHFPLENNIWFTISF